jgi:hypothetical protein
VKVTTFNIPEDLLVENHTLHKFACRVERANGWVTIASGYSEQEARIRCVVAARRRHRYGKRP